MNEKRLRFWVIIAVIVVVAYWFTHREPTPYTLAAAVQAGKVTVTIQARGPNGSSVHISGYEPPENLGTVVVVIPSGTVLYPSGSGTQRLMTATSIRIVLTKDHPTFDSIVPTYCLDEFANVPQRLSTMSLAPAVESAVAESDSGATTTTIETEPLHKLADCMSSSSASQSDRQLAVWAVEEGMLSKTRDQALKWLTRQFVATLTHERRDQLHDQKPLIRAKFPDLSDEDIEGDIKRELADGMPELHKIAAAQADQQLTSFLAHDKTLLASCGYGNDEAIFQ